MQRPLIAEATAASARPKSERHLIGWIDEIWPPARSDRREKACRTGVSGKAAAGPWRPLRRRKLAPRRRSRARLFSISAASWFFLRTRIAEDFHDRPATLVRRLHAAVSGGIVSAGNFSIAATSFPGCATARATPHSRITARRIIGRAFAQRTRAGRTFPFNSNQICVVTVMQRHENEFPWHRSHRATFPANPLCSWVLVIMIGAIRR
jgi:hypothetical protein